MSVGPTSDRRDLTDGDLFDLLRDFYDALERDPLVGPYFAAVDMSEHLPRITDFWSTMLFGTRRYSSNAFQPHARLEGLTSEHFGRWLATLEGVIDRRFAGRYAEEMKTSAHRIAYSMQLRMGIAPLSGAWDRIAAGRPGAAVPGTQGEEGQ